MRKEHKCLIEKYGRDIPQRFCGNLQLPQVLWFGIDLRSPGTHKFERLAHGPPELAYKVTAKDHGTVRYANDVM